ncbi:SymE family type I addiction module toxin [Pinibacter aurantiacus]|uniref:Type I toxin-antitoxin system SymE family toxin n=1 Tax=Pinibacter aurantiacus TaxID=2851599 RepID=A0A9E2SAE6_9BACT|nr:SymE family type I addiction module toxin [Pinibacter aurantiacus]MBV4357599.1 type I toxin-antitoxin system SymE family toxin [Pinibacter aurantiacus]
MYIIEKKPRVRKLATTPKPKRQPKEPSNIRRLKISSFIFVNKTNSTFPYLRLCGKWLQQAGFLPEHYVNITVSENKLIIEREN